MQELFTLKYISQKTSIPESTLQYYRTTYPNYLPTAGNGKRKRYYPLALDVFTTISNSAKQGMDKLAITAILEKEYPCINVKPDYTQVTLQYNSEKTNEEKMLLIDSYKHAMQQITSITVNTVAQQKDESYYLNSKIQKLDNKVQELENEVQQLKGMEDRIRLEILDRMKLIETQLCQNFETKTKEMVMNIMAEIFKKAE